MARYTEYIHNAKSTAADRFFGERRFIDSRFFRFDGVIDENNIIVIVTTVKMLRNGSVVMVVGNDQAIYLQDWQIYKVMTKSGIDGWAVKLSRKHFKPYTFKDGFYPEFFFRKSLTFDDLVKRAESQKEAVRTQGTITGVRWLENSKGEA